MKSLILLLVFSIFMCSCSRKIIPSTIVAYKITHGPSSREESGPEQIQKYLIKNFNGSIKVENGYAIIKIAEGNSKSVKIISQDTGHLVNNYPYTYIVGNKYFFSDIESWVQDPAQFKAANRLKYFERSFVLQALSVPYKIRPQLKGLRYGNTFPNQVKTGFTANISAGWKFSYNSFSGKKNYWGSDVNRYSIIPGVFFGLGAVDLSKDNTLTPDFVSRSALLKSTGIFLMLNINRFGFGYALGKDYAVGNGSREWVYRDEVWHGLALSIDIVN